MTVEIDRHDVETDAGTYQIIEHIDEEGGGMGNPLTEFDQTGFSFAIFQNGRYEVLNTLGGVTGYPKGSAGNAVATWLDHGYDDDEIERRFALWQRITGDKTVLVTYEADADRSTWYRCLVLVDYDDKYPDWDRKASALATIKEYEAWAAGEVYGYVLKSPGGEVLESSWGFIGDSGREYMIDQAKDEARAYAVGRLQEASAVGAGFVGII